MWLIWWSLYFQLPTIFQVVGVLPHLPLFCPGRPWLWPVCNGWMVSCSVTVVFPQMTPQTFQIYPNLVWNEFAKQRHMVSCRILQNSVTRFHWHDWASALSSLVVCRSVCLQTFLAQRAGGFICQNWYIYIWNPAALAPIIAMLKVWNFYSKCPNFSVCLPVSWLQLCSRVRLWTHERWASRSLNFKTGFGYWVLRVLLFQMLLKLSKPENY